MTLEKLEIKAFSFIEIAMKITECSYQDAWNMFMLKHISELHNKIEELENKLKSL